MENHPIKLLFIAGARPNFMKIAPLIRAAQAHNASARNGEPKLEWRLVHTGQHYDARMSNIFFHELDIPAPDVNLEVGSGTHAQQTANIMLRFEPVCLQEKPDWIVVVGDVNSTAACTIVASKLGIKVAHVEAGLRSFDRTMPEEINRLLTDSLADLLLTPSQDASENLLREGAADLRIKLVGNIMIDALMSNLNRARSSSILEECSVKDRDFVYVTLHRPSNVDHQERLTKIMASLAKMALQMPVVFPMHPRTKSKLKEFNVPEVCCGDLKILEPIGYFDSLCLAERARLVVTDSGGLQEESTFFRTPCLTLRPNTERPITITLGSNRLTSVGSLLSDIGETLRQERRRGLVPPLWDGKAAERIVVALLGRGLPAAAVTRTPGN